MNCKKFVDFFVTTVRMYCNMYTSTCSTVCAHIVIHNHTLFVRINNIFVQTYHIVFDGSV